MAEEDLSGGGRLYKQSMSYVGIIVRSYLKSIEGFLKLATTLDIRTDVQSVPEPIDRDGPFVELVRKNIGSAIALVVRGTDTMDYIVQAVTSSAIDIFENKHLPSLYSVDKKMLYQSSASFKESLAISIINSIVEAAPICLLYTSDAADE